MEKFVWMILGMSMEAMIVLAAVLVLRLAFRRLPKSYACALWFLVLFRLLCPVAISSSASLMPGGSIWQDGVRVSAGIEEAAGAEQPGNRTIEEWKALQEQTAQGRTGTGTAPEEASGNASLAVQDVLGGKQTFSERAHRLASQVSSGFLSFWEEWGIWLSLIWLAGVVGLTAAYAVQFVNWKERVRGCMRVPLRETADNGVRPDGQDTGGHGRMRGTAGFLLPCRIRLAESARIDEPYVCGLLRPVIYLPAGMEEKERSYVLCHEKMHIRHFDPFIRLLWQAALVLHWFNPLVWLAVSLVQKDMEMFCDESVLRQCGNGARRDYALALLHFSVKKSGLPFPVAFGESDTESRIRHILKNRKPTIAIGALAVLVIICAAVFLLTDPKESGTSEENLRALAEEALADGQEVLLFDYADYDGDGTEEAFAYAGTTEDGEIAAGGALWFVNADGAKRLASEEEPLDLALNPAVYEMADGQKFWSAETAGGSSWSSVLWTVRDGEPAESVLSWKGMDFRQSQEGDYILDTDFWGINKEDGTGHEHVPCYFFYENGDFREYGAVRLENEEFFALEGARDAYGPFALDGSWISEILLRGNGRIQVNMETQDRYYYAVFQMENGTVKAVWDEYFGGAAQLLDVTMADDSWRGGDTELETLWNRAQESGSVNDLQSGAAGQTDVSDSGIQGDADRQPVTSADGADGVSEDRGEKILDTASAWAIGFVNRDGSAIEAVSAGADAMEAMGFEKAGDVYLVGQSSPWPWLEDFQINYSLTEDEAVIFYYARTSDPKVSTWKQTLQLEEKDGAYVVSGCETDMEAIASAAAFRERYHYEDQQEYAIGNIGYRFKDTPMDILSKTEDGEMKPELAVLLAQSRQPRTPEDTAAWWLDLDGGSAVVVDSPWEDKVCLRWRFSDGETDVIVLAHPTDENGDAFSLWMVEDIMEEDEWQVRRLKARLADFYMEEASRLAESGLEYEDGLISAMADGKDVTVLLARSGAVELYGLVSEGNAQGVFIKEGNDSQYFDWYYTDSHAICPGLEQGDFDGDGQDELAVILRNGHGTEFSVESLILLEKEKGRWEQREYPYSAYETQLQEEIACGYDRETGLLTFSDVKKDVILGEENIAELMGGDAQFAAVTFGNMLSYAVQDDGIYMKLQPRIEVEGEAIGRYGSLVLQARVRYDGDSFWLEEYEMVRE